MADDIQPLPKRGTAQAGQLKLLKLTVFVLRPAMAHFVTNHTTLQIRTYVTKRERNPDSPGTNALAVKEAQSHKDMHVFADPKR